MDQVDPLQYQAQADAIAQRAADQLRALLRTLAAAIRPFPEFPGSYFTYGIEVEPVDSALGCVVLGDDGELYELQVGIDVAEAATGDPASARAEHRLPLDDLPPATYIAYAHAAVGAAVAYLEARGGAD